MCIFCFCNSEYKGFIFIKLFVAIIFSLKDWLSNHEIKEILLFIVFPEATSCAQNCSKFFSPVCSYLLCCLWILFYWHIYTHWLKFWSSWVLISHLKCGFMSFQEKKASNLSLRGLSFMCCRWNVCQMHWFQESSPALKNSWLHTWIMSKLKYLTIVQWKVKGTALRE